MITEEMMAAAAAEMNEAMLRSLPEPEDCYHEFSAKFEKKMKRVIYRADHPLQFRVLQKVASIILVLFLGFATLMVISPTVRASVFGWIREQYESYISYYFESHPSADSSDSEYYIAGLDDEFQLFQKYDNDGMHFYVYTTQTENQLHFIYSTDHYDNIFYVKQENFYVEPVLINGNPGELYTSIDGTESNCIVWCDEDTHIMFYLSAYLEPEILISYAKSTIQKKPF
jgi:hypothetical protein